MLMKSVTGQCRYLQIVFPQVLGPPSIFVLVEHRWNLRPVWLWVRLIRPQTTIEGAGRGGLWRETPESSQKFTESSRNNSVGEGVVFVPVHWAPVIHCFPHPRRHWKKNPLKFHFILIWNTSPKTTKQQHLSDWSWKNSSWAIRFSF